VSGVILATTIKVTISYRPHDEVYLNRKLIEGIRTSQSFESIVLLQIPSGAMASANVNPDSRENKSRRLLEKSMYLLVHVLCSI